MLLRRNKDLYDTVTALAGVRDFTSDEKNDILSLANRRLTMAYNKSNIWDRYLVIGEERRIARIKVERAENDAYNGYYVKNGKTQTLNQAAYANADVYVKSDNKDFFFYKTSQNLWFLSVIDAKLYFRSYNRYCYY
jgi:predicted SPOUT superfamily RNA methylase MTH1